MLKKLKFILIFLLVSAGSFLLVSKSKDKKPLKAEDAKELTVTNPESIPRQKVQAKVGDRLILTVPENILGATKVGGFSWKHLPYRGEALKVESISHRHLMESFVSNMAGLYIVKLPKDAKQTEYLFIVDEAEAPSKNNRLCSMVLVQMYHPKTDNCVTAHNSCEEADLEEQGYLEDANHKCP